jgi:hypothetical protein
MAKFPRTKMVAAGEMGCNPGIHHLIQERRTNEYKTRE